MEKKARDFGLLLGKAAETSGGLLCVVKENDVEEVLKQSGGWLIGRTERGNRTSEIKADFELIEVE